jgi:hypothetical protein
MKMKILKIVLEHAGQVFDGEQRRRAVLIYRGIEARGGENGAGRLYFD